MDSLLQDVRHAVRALRKTPAFTLAATLTLALGLGVNIAVFTVMNATLLESMPVREPDRLVTVYTWSQEHGDHFEFSYPLYVDLRDGNRTLSGLAAYVFVAVGVSAGGQSDRVTAEFVTSNYFPVLGVDLAAGPGFTGGDELPGSAPAAIVSHRLWTTLFGGDPSIIGKTLLVNGKTVAIVGLAPRAFEGIVRGQRADVWMTVAQFNPIRNRPDTLLRSRESSWLALFGRLAPGVSGERAAADLTGIGSGLNVINAGPGFIARTRPASAGDIGLVEGLERPLTLLALVVGFILIVASANVANLLLARSHTRRPEIALRRALGASRGRVVRQMLTEAAVLALTGGAAGLLLAYWFVALFEVRTAAGTLLTLPLEPDGRVVAFAAALSAVVAFGTALLPAFGASRPDLASAIKPSGDSARAGGGRQPLRGALVIVQVALSLVLVVGAGLFLRSLGQLKAVDPALVNDRVVAATLNLSLRGYDEPRGRQLYRDLLERVRTVPGVESAALAYVLPVTAGGMRMDLQGASLKPPVPGMVAIELVPVSPDFFRTVSVPLVAGRDFTAADVPASRPVVIVNETMHRTFWPDGNPLGQVLALGPDRYEVVGVARDTKYRSLREGSRNVMYLPYAQSHQTAANLLLRTTLPLEGVLQGVRRELREVDSALPLYNVRTMAEHLNRSLYLDRLRAELIGYLAALALGLAAIGIYGMVSYTVAARTREVGIRVALGAPPGAVLRMVLGGGIRLTALGLGGGLLLSFWLTRKVSSDLFGVTPTDPVTLAVACGVLLAVAVIATLLPARRATTIDPIIALRSE